MLPMLMTNLSESSIASNRIATFLNLAEPDKGVVSRKSRQGEFSVSIQGGPSFSWANAKDQFMPATLDPFHRESMKIEAAMKKLKPVLIQQYVDLKAKHYAHIISDSMIDQTVKDQLGLNPTEPAEDYVVLDQWSNELEAPFIGRLEKYQQYNASKYKCTDQDIPLNQMKQVFMHIQTIDRLILKNESTEAKDLPNVLHDLDI